MTTGLLLDSDEMVGHFVAENQVQGPVHFDRAFGVIKDGVLVGGVLFQNWNTANLDVSYYGRNTLTPGIIRCLAKIIISTFDPVRVTVMTSRRNRRLRKALMKLGFCLEGAQRCFYGPRDCDKNAAVRYVMFRERVYEIAKMDLAKAG